MIILQEPNVDDGFGGILLLQFSLDCCHNSRCVKQLLAKINYDWIIVTATN